VVIIPVVKALGGIVLSVQRGIGIASNRIEVTNVPVVLAGLVRYPYFLSEWARLAKLSLSPFLLGVVTGERSRTFLAPCG
jgi:hypothetical protein